MVDLKDRLPHLSPKRLALVALELEERLRASEAAQREPITVIGMGCRVPGAEGPAAFWRLLDDGIDAITVTPRDRWDADALYSPDPDVPGTISTRFGGYLRDIQHFDPAFFGISRREARSMDPQQRLVLEVGWEALEHAGQSADRLHQTATGVFIGVCNADYAHLLTASDVEHLDTYMATGNAASVVSGRVAYTLGLQGPALSIDTACSSSLVAIHAAAQSLRAGECALALAGGVNVMCIPEVSMALSRSHMLAPDGRCKGFDASADGFVRGEGCGIVVLKRLSDARADGDRILAVIRGSAVNQDGRSSGLTAPNARAQEAVICAALANGGVDPLAISYVEAHGTGTSLGDPIEARALGAALCRGRPVGRPLHVGSVKSNIGHLESAAGVAGFIKVVLALQHRRLPKHLHFREPSRHIPWDELPIRVTAEATEWTSDAPLLAGVSSFGFSGTNAHVILEEAPLEHAAATRDRSARLLTISAKSNDALRDLATAYAVDLRTRDSDFSAFCATATNGRAHFDHRLALAAASASDAADQIETFLAGNESRVSVGERPVTAAPDVAFLFTGQGAQYAGMGREFYESEPVFRETVDRCSSILEPRLGHSLTDLLYGPDASSADLDETAYTQPAIFTIDYALAAMWRAWGVEPAFVLGHSLGEYAAASVAGVMSLEDALHLVVERGRLMHSLPRVGSMVAVMAAERDVLRAIDRRDHVSIAAVNGPDSVVITGVSSEVAAVVSELEAAGVECRRLAISNGFHSPLVDPILDEFERAASRVSWQLPQVALVSNLTGREVGADVCDAAYWRRHLREPVQFGRSIRTLWEQGIRTFVEVGPHSTLLGMARRAVPESEAVWVPSLRRDQPAWTQVLASAAALYAAGVSFDWQAVEGGRRLTPIDLPTYPFRRERCWVAPTDSRDRVLARGVKQSSHPLLGARLRTAVPTFETRLDAQHTPMLAEHRVNGRATLPAAAFAELGMAACREVLGAAPDQVETLTLLQPLIVPDDEPGVLVQCVAQFGEGSVATFEIASADDDHGARWTRHATGRVLVGRGAPAVVDIAALRRDCPSTISGDEYYALLRHGGVEAGKSVLRAIEVGMGDGHAFARMHFTPDQIREADGFWLHPTLVDACMLCAAATLPASERVRDARGGWVVAGVAEIRRYRAFEQDVFVDVALRDIALDGRRASIEIVVCSERGERIVQLSGIALVRAQQKPGVATADVYETVWREAAPAVHRLSPVVQLAPVRDRVMRLLGQPQATAAMAAYDDFYPRLERMVNGWVRKALGTVTPEHEERDRRAPAALRVADRHRRLLGRLLEVAANSNGGVADPDVAARDLAARYPDFAAQISLTDRCGRVLTDLLTGDRDPLDLLFPDGSLEALEALYQHSPIARVYNDLVSESVAEVVAAMQGRPVRVLEIGAGTGGTTAAVLPRLDPRNSVYVFTDLSPLFLGRARDKFAHFPFVEYALFDAESDAATGLASDQFDIVIAANVLHATADLAASLATVRRLLAPGGVLILLEGSARQAWIDVTFGLTDGWWRFSDAAVRPDYPLITPSRWTELLAATGFDQQIVIGGEGERPSAQQFVLLARATTHATDAAARGRRRIVVGESALAASLAADERIAVAVDADAAALPAALARCGDGAPVDVVCHWPASFPEFDAGAAQRLVWQAAQCAQAFICAHPNTGSRLWFVTEGAQPVGDRATKSIADAALVGLARGISVEHPDTWGGLIDVDPVSSPDEQARAVLNELARSDAEDQVAVCAGRRMVPRLQPRAKTVGAPLTVRPGAAYLITGGLGGVGVCIATWLAAHGATHVVLTGRRPLPPRESWLDAHAQGATHDTDDERRAAAVRALEDAGLAVTYVAVDAADRAGMSILFDRFGRDLPALAGVFHAAVDMSSHPVADLDEDDVATMMRAKAGGAALLDELTLGRDLDFVVLCSSTTALWGVRGLSHYAAANTCLDALAHRRRAEGRPFVSVNWGTWDAMRLASDADRHQFEQAGMRAMSASSALDALRGIGVRGPAQVAIASVDWRALISLYESRRPRPFFADLRPTAASIDGGRDAGALVDRVRVASPDERADILHDVVSRDVARILGADDPASLDGNRGLFEMGMDSLMSVELKARLEKAVGRSLPSSLTFNYPNINALVRFLDTELSQTPDAPTAPSMKDDVSDTSEEALAQLLAARLDELQ